MNRMQHGTCAICGGVQYLIEGRCRECHLSAIVDEDVFEGTPSLLTHHDLDHFCFRVVIQSIRMGVHPENRGSIDLQSTTLVLKFKLLLMMGDEYVESVADRGVVACRLLKPVPKSVVIQAMERGGLIYGEEE